MFETKFIAIKIYKLAEPYLRNNVFALEKLL